MSTQNDSLGPLLATGRVDDQDGAIVGRQLPKTAGRGLTAFAHDFGRALGEHSSPQQASIHVTEGRAEVSVAGRP